MLFKKLITDNQREWDQYTNHPFAKQIASGEIKKEKFENYIGQDCLYLEAYRNCYSHMASFAQKDSEKSYFQQYSISEIEGDMAAMYNVDMSNIQTSTVTSDYISYLYKLLVEGNSLEKLIGIGVCTIGYGQLANNIHQSTEVINKKYQSWIETYASTEYQTEVDGYIQLIDEYSPSEEQYNKLSKIFRDGCNHEIAFFNQALEIPKPIVLTIAGSDSGGGAGIQADIKAISANGCYGASVITAITAQSTTGVYGIEGVSTELIEQQLQVINDDLDVNVIKIGMLGSTAVINTVAANLPHDIKIVLDPVMVAKDNTKLLPADAIDCLVQTLCPLAYVITPNIEEANIILNTEILTVDDMREACLELATMCNTNVLLKGGHLTGDELVDILYYDHQFYDFTTKRINTINTHGTGCSLSSSIAANLAKGYKLDVACKNAIEYVQNGIIQNFPIGHGKGPINHFHNSIIKEQYE